MQVTHTTGLPYNPQGQGIVERAHRTLKSYLIKQKGGIMKELPPTPRVAIAMALFTMNFLKIWMIRVKMQQQGIARIRKDPKNL